MKWTFVSACLLAAASACAQSCPCCDSLHRQFDFWVGDWNVYDTAGNLVGTNSITIEQDSCLLVEPWQSSGKHRGTSYNFYDGNTRKWHQTWIDVGGFALVMDGGWQGGAMVLRSAIIEGQGKKLYHEIAWTPDADGNVRQLWVTRDEIGAVSSTLFDGLYKRR